MGWQQHGKGTKESSGKGKGNWGHQSDGGKKARQDGQICDDLIPLFKRFLAQEMGNQGGDQGGKQGRWRGGNRNQSNSNNLADPNHGQSWQTPRLTRFCSACGLDHNDPNGLNCRKCKHPLPAWDSLPEQPAPATSNSPPVSPGSLATQDKTQQPNNGKGATKLGKGLPKQGKGYFSLEKISRKALASPLYHLLHTRRLH